MWDRFVQYYKLLHYWAVFDLLPRSFCSEMLLKKDLNKTNWCSLIKLSPPWPLYVASSYTVVLWLRRVQHALSPCLITKSVMDTHGLLKNPAKTHLAPLSTSGSTWLLTLTIGNVFTVSTMVAVIRFRVRNSWVSKTSVGLFASIALKLWKCEWD